MSYESNASDTFERINDYSSVKITLASPSDIRSWSFGEVKKPETINYRTYRPEKDGLFCERIFGPEKDFECACGKYKGTKFKGIICDRCQVRITHSRVRRKRMGHINLSAPCAHIWFFKAVPSHLSNLLGMKASDMEKVLYFQDYVVVDAGETPLKKQQVLTEDEHRDAIRDYGTNFKAMMGAEAIKELFAGLDINKVAEEIRADLEATKSKQKVKDLSKRLKIIEQLRASTNDPSWMILDVVPVIPPDLRPLVLLDSGNFATSDLNDLYRRIINRNNRLKKLMDLNAPEVIVRNEKRMLQQSVDALFDNGRCRRPVLGSSNRPLKSLADMIKGKQGRFRENLLGKRVDYSARSVIVVGPNLKLYQCGLPKKIALELYQPFIIRRLKDLGLVDTIKSAKKMLERRDPEVWDVLEEVIHEHPVMLNRAPTLHRMGIQAFEPVLVEGNAIRLHPLVTTGFNADFDGDQMAVHLPLSVEAQAEASILMLSPHNIFSPANGNPIISPSQDIVLGVYYVTAMPEAPSAAVIKELVDTRKGRANADKATVAQLRQFREYRDIAEALFAFDLKKITVHTPIVVKLPADRYEGVVESEKGSVTPIAASRRCVTTVGRLIFNEILPKGMPYYNCALGKKGCARVIDDTYARKGRPATIDLLDNMKAVGFKQSTLAGISFGITDLRIPAKKKEIIDATQTKVLRIEKSYQAGAITAKERYGQLIELWTHCREAISKELMKELKADRRDAGGIPVPIEPNDKGEFKGKLYLNPVWLMADSGARGNQNQILQLAGMRGLMAKPSGEIIETPIKANAREGLTVLEYFSSTHGARKGLSDTALKTADAGYMTRKLCDVAQNVFITSHDCGSKRGITKRAIFKGESIDIPLRDRIIGRVSLESISNPVTGEVIVRENGLITATIAAKIESLGINEVVVRSPLTTEAAHGMSVLDYGMDLSTGRLVEEGLAVGIIAAQSIGEPGTQLTMRTFHTGGVAQRTNEATSHASTKAGTVVIRDAGEVEGQDEQGQDCLVTLKRNGEIAVLDAAGKELEKFAVPYGAYIRVKSGDKIKAGAVLVNWDPHRTPILAGVSGKVRFKDIEVGSTVRKDGAALLVIEHKGDKHPQILVEDASGKVQDFHHLPTGARIEVQDGMAIKAGHMLARQAKMSAKTADIVGGLPRVTEIFEARVPKDAAIMAEISGTVEIKSGVRRGKVTLLIKGGNGVEAEQHLSQDRHLLVHTGDVVEAGQSLTEGPLDPKDILKVKGEEALFEYLLDEVQKVYRVQGVAINDKHIETILAQMLRKIRVENPGDADMLPHEVVDKYRFKSENDRMSRSVKIKESGDSTLKAGTVILKSDLKEIVASLEAEGKEAPKAVKCRPATGEIRLLGISKAALASDSFLSGASFQETSKVLTEAAIACKSDHLVGLKENVLLGHLIPVGTGFSAYQAMEVVKLAEAAGTPDLTAEQEYEAAVAMAESAGAELPSEVGATIGQSKVIEKLMEEYLQQPKNKK